MKTSDNQVWKALENAGWDGSRDVRAFSSKGQAPLFFVLAPHFILSPRPFPDPALYLEKLIEMGCSIHQCDTSPSTTLYHVLAIFGTPVSMPYTWETLFEKYLHRLDINTQNEHGFTALNFAAKGADLEDIERLLRWGANPQIPSHAGVTPLIMANQARRPEVVQLLENWIFKQECQQENTQLHQACPLAPPKRETSRL